MVKASDELYRERTQRIKDAIQLKEPDSVPFAPFVTYFTVNYAGFNFERAMHDYDELIKIVKKFTLDFQPDVFPDNFRVLSWAPTMEILDYKQLVWPGHGGKPDITHQFVEGEYMKVEEYDAFLADPTDFLMRSFLPRAFGALEPLNRLRPLAWGWYTRMASYVADFGTPEVTGALESLIKAGQESLKMTKKANEFIAEMESLGFPRQFVASTNAPLDYIGDYLRGTRGMMLDMYRNPDKLLQTIERLLPLTIEFATSATKTDGANRVFIPLHKGIDGFMSPKQFETFYWPSLRRLMLALIDAGFTPNPLWEGDCTSRLEVIGDLPKGKAVYWFERTDLFKAKEILGDNICIEGGVPSSMMIGGTPDEVRAYCKKLIDVVGKGGGFIMNGDVGIPDEARVENVKAMADFVREYGKYR
ncbi:uroporphyrinogen decarboxylase family protein [Chloroflexota bacterium]